MTLESKTSRLEDPGARLLDGLSSGWDRYGRMILIGLGVVLAIAVGVFFTARARATAEEEAAGRLAEANIYFWQGAYDRSLPLARQVAEQWPNAASGVDARRLAGDSQFWLGHFKDAAAEYQSYLDRNKTGLVADAVRRSLAYCLESNHQFKEAAVLYEGLVGKLERESSAEFLYAAARCYRQLRQSGEADQRLKRLLDEFGETSYADRARVLRAELAAAPR